MTKSFDEWWSERKKNGFVPTFSDVASNAFKAGKQSKQAEVDELKCEMINKTNEAYADGQKSMRKMIKSNEDELQKQIDEAMKMLAHGEGYGYEQCTRLSINILKGNTNEH